MGVWVLGQSAVWHCAVCLQAGYLVSRLFLIRLWWRGSARWSGGGWIDWRFGIMCGKDGTIAAWWNETVMTIISLTMQNAGANSRALTIGRDRIQTWALEEARRRLEAEGILPDPDDEPKNQA